MMYMIIKKEFPFQGTAFYEKFLRLCKRVHASDVSLSFSEFTASLKCKIHNYLYKYKSSAKKLDLHITRKAKNIYDNRIINQSV